MRCDRECVFPGCYFNTRPTAVEQLPWSQRRDEHRYLVPYDFDFCLTSTLKEKFWRVQCEVFWDNYDGVPTGLTITTCEECTVMLKWELRNQLWIERQENRWRKEEDRVQWKAYRSTTPSPKLPEFFGLLRPPLEDELEIRTSKERSFQEVLRAISYPLPQFNT